MDHHYYYYCPQDTRKGIKTINHFSMSTFSDFSTLHDYKRFAIVVKLKAGFLLLEDLLSTETVYYVTYILHMLCMYVCCV